MAEKQSKGFGQIEKDEAFQLGIETPHDLKDEKEIVLNIAEVRNSKVLLRQKADFLHFSGNPLLDNFKRWNDFFVDHSKIKVRDKATFFRLLSVMINSGLPLIRSLRTLGGQSDNIPRLKKILFAMADSIENGKSLSQSMEVSPDVFSEAQIGIVRAGEISGQLNKTLRDLAEELEKTASITSKIKGALIYPLTILCLLFISVFIMMVAVIPQLSKLFVEAGKELPLPTKILIFVSNFCVSFWPWIIIGFLGLIFGMGIWKKTRAGRYSFDFFILKIPIFGKIIQKAILAKFARSFSNLLKNGIPIIRSLEIVGNAIGNEVYKKRLFLTAQDMRSGIPMAENLSDSKLFPPMLVNMIEIGEQTAQIENVTLKVAEFYDEEVDNVVKSLTKIMEPLIIVIIGVVVGGLVAAIMLPIIQLTNFAGSM